MKIERLVLKDAKGIQNLELDFTGIKGIIGITGDNGIGKSTLLWHLLPYSMDVLKGWTLKQRFGKDGYKYLKYILNDRIHEIEIKIEKGDALCSYKIDGVEKNPSLKVTLYNDVVEKEFMPIAMATHSLYSVEATATNRGKNGDLTSSLALLDPKKRKEFFMELFGLDEYNARYALASDKYSSIAKEYDGLKSQLDYIDEAYQDVHEPVDVDALKTEVDKLKVELDKEQKRASQYKTFKDVSNSLKVLVDKYGKRETVEYFVGTLRAKLEDIRIGLSSISYDGNRYNELNADVMDLKKEMIALKSKIKKLEEAKALFTHGKELKEVYKEKASELDMLKERITSANDMREAVGKLKSASENVPCDIGLRSSCPLYKLAQFDMPDIKNLEDKAKESQKVLANLKDEMLTYSQKIKEAIPGMDIKQENIDSELSKAETKLEIDTKRLSMLSIELDRLRLSSGTYSQKRAQLKDTENQINELSSVISKMKTYEDMLSGVDIEGFDPDIYDKLMEEYTALAQKISLEEENTKRYNEYISKKADLEDKLKTLEVDLNEYKVIVDAYSSKGLVMYELENLCPAVTDMANKLLEDTEYIIRIDTYKYINKDKKNERIKEIFDITVFVHGEARGYLELSAGQRVLPDLALAQAASTFLSQQYGMKTIFLDERDGSLSQQNRLVYIDMLKKAHLMSERANTLIISHDPAVWSGCDTIIYLNKNGVKIGTPQEVL